MSLESQRLALIEIMQREIDFRQLNVKKTTREIKELQKLLEQLVKMRGKFPLSMEELHELSDLETNIFEDLGRIGPDVKIKKPAPRDKGNYSNKQRDEYF